MQKRTLLIALVASMFIAVPLACSSSSSDSGTTNGGDGGGGGGGGGDGGGSGGGDSGSGGGGDSGSSKTDSGSGTDSGLLPDGGSGITGCGDPGDPGNSLGIGKYCTGLSDCSGTFCAALFGGPNFCTNACTAADAGGSPTACGAGASCQCQDGQCGCTPDACL